MKNTNISTYGCSTLGEQIEKNRRQRKPNFILVGMSVGFIFFGILFIISFLTIPR